MIRFQGKLLLRGAFHFGANSFSNKGLVTWIDGSWKNTATASGLVDRMTQTVFPGNFQYSFPIIEMSDTNSFMMDQPIGRNGFTVGALVKPNGAGSLWGNDTQVGYNGKEWALTHGSSKITAPSTSGWQTVISTVNKAGIGTLYLGSVKEGFELGMGTESVEPTKFGQLPAQIAELVVWDRAISVAERNQFNLYLTEKWQVG